MQSSEDERRQDFMDACAEAPGQRHCEGLESDWVEIQDPWVQVYRGQRPTGDDYCLKFREHWPDCQAGIKAAQLHIKWGSAALSPWPSCTSCTGQTQARSHDAHDEGWMCNACLCPSYMTDSVVLILIRED